jgi:hypothetical protein
MRELLRLSVSLFAVAPAALMAAPLAAQDADVDAGEPESEIIVTGRGLDPALSTGIYAATSLEREVIVASASGRIDDVLRGVAGFQQFRRSDSRSSNPSAQGVTLRAIGGNATSRALVLHRRRSARSGSLAGAGRGRLVRARWRARLNWKAPGRT